ncbi:MAG: ATP-binding protein [Deltaproteobacteria bacterium]|nr:ATP-binding protein [Deltaproteobacteria bacterium]
MKEISVISGKGGTGKTSLVASFAAFAENKVLADCDVDAADLYLVVQPETIYQESFSGGGKAEIQEDQCTDCGLCLQQCRFDAISYPPSQNGEPAQIPWVNPIFCEGCRLCARICPVEAIAFEPAESGLCYISKTPYGPMVHARLGIAQGNSGKLVSLVREKAKAIAEKESRDYIIVDGPPGVGCPVIASITGSDLVLIVSEPTLSGRHDMLRAAELTAHFQIPTLLCINKWDIHPETADRIEREARQLGILPAGRIGYDPSVTKAQIHKTSVASYPDSPAKKEMHQVWENVIKTLNKSETG